MEDQSTNENAASQDTGSVVNDAPVAQPNTLIQSESNKVEIPAKFIVDGKPDYDALTKSYTELEKKIGSKVAVSDVSEYDFQFQSPENWNQEEFTAFKDQAKELGLSKDQFNAAMSLYEQNVNNVLDQYTPSPERAQQALQEKWGNDYDANIRSAAKAVETFYPDAFSDPELGSNPKFLEAMAIIGKQLQEDKAPGSVKTGVGSGLSKLEVEALMQRPDYWSNKEVQAQVANWYNSR